MGYTRRWRKGTRSESEWTNQPVTFASRRGQIAIGGSVYTCRYNNTCIYNIYIYYTLFWPAPTEWLMGHVSADEGSRKLVFIISSQIFHLTIIRRDFKLPRERFISYIISGKHILGVSGFFLSAQVRLSIQLRYKRCGSHFFLRYQQSTYLVFFTKHHISNSRQYLNVW